MGPSLQKGIKKFVNGYRAKKWERLCKKVLRNLSMGTGRKIGTSLQKVLRNSSMSTGQKKGTSFPKGIKKFVNVFRAKKWERLCKKVLRNSSMGAGQIVRIYDKK